MVCSLRKSIASMAVCAVLVVSTTFATAPTASAEESVEDLTAAVETTAKEYDEASAKVDELNQKIADNEKKIDELEAKIDEQEEASSDALRSLYKYQRSAPSLINLVFSSEDVSSLFGTLDYLNRCEQNNLDIIQEQIDNKNELEATTKQLKADKEEASQAKTDAANALADAKAARQKAMEAATEKAAAELEAQNNQGNSQSSSVLTASVSENSQDTSQMKSSVDTDDVDWSQEKSDFVDEWTSRINNYLAGSPLAGYGETFAEAAWDYGVDPRWSPAIACVESGKGASCFRSHNAWGWGTSSWSSWEEAITAHVSGLARIYGSTLTPSAAQKYCPSNATYWYNKCLSEMNKI